MAVSEKAEKEKHLDVFVVRMNFKAERSSWWIVVWRLRLRLIVRVGEEQRVHERYSHVMPEHSIYYSNLIKIRSRLDQIISIWNGTNPKPWIFQIGDPRTDSENFGLGDFVHPW